MKKQFTSFLSVVMCLILSVGIFTACGSEPDEPQKHTISFYADAALIGRVETAGNEEIGLPAAPDKDGHSFEGWFFDPGTWQSELTASTYAHKPLSEDASVYAFYREIEGPDLPQEYTVTFDVDQGTPIDPITTARIETEPQTARDGYTFLGWYKESSFVNKVTFPYEVTKAQTLFARWEKSKYTVHFDTDGGTALNDMTVSRIERSPATEKEGYTFDGWYTEKAFLNKVTFPYEVTKAQTLYAKWTRNETESPVFTVDSSGVLTGVSGLTESDMRVEIPEQVNGVTVKEIGQKLFKDNQNIGSLIIPDSVRYLGYAMCSGCTNLKKVQLPAGLTVIPDNAFENCSSLTAINFPDTLVQIRADAFGGTALTEFTAPDSLESIWHYAFKDCKNLGKVDLKNVRSLNEGVFQNCTALQSIKLPDTLTDLNGTGNTFSGCTSLTEIDMPANPTAIPHSMFNGTAFYNDPANWEQGVLYADGYLLTANSELTAYPEYTVKEGTIVIADNAFGFAGVGGTLKKVVLPDGLRRIGTRAFSKLFSLTEINIPDSVRSVGYAAFEATGFDEASHYTDGGLYIGNWLVKVENAARTSFTVREGTVGVADGKDTALFPTQAQKVSRLSLPSSLKYVGARSFARLKITELQLPAGLKTLGNGGFADCFYLTAVNLGECTQLESIGEGAFIQAAISEITIPESVVTVGELVFNHNTVDLTIHCEVSAQPDGWDEDWAYSYREGVTITVDWKKTQERAAA